MADWLTPADVAAYLDLPAGEETDDNLTLATAAVKAAVERRHPELDYADPLFDTLQADFKGAAVMWAALIYQARNAPSGYAGYGDETMIFDNLGTRRAEIMRLLRWRQPELA